jgi:CRP/FNR family transcriptional regulator
MSEIAKLIDQCPTLSGLGTADREAVLRHAIAVHVPPGTLLFDTGSACQALPLLLSGSIRVFKRAESGREISLYRVRQGELCIVTVSCLIGAAVYPATGIAESAVSAIALPRPLFLQLSESHPAFRKEVFHLFAERLSDLMQLVEEVAFRKLDQRLAALLLARAPLITGSHQKLADELGSVREIVSRLLKQFEEHGWIQLSRERVEIRDVDALNAFALHAERAH